MIGVVAETSHVIRNPDMVCELTDTAHSSVHLTAMQNAKDHDHHTANAATNDDALAPRLEGAVMAQHNVKNAITNEPRRLAILAIAKLPKHPNPVDSEAAAHLGMVLVRTAQLPSRKSLASPNRKHSLAKYKWAMVARMKTPRPRWRG
jgi:hypothetical protein